jgi:hypothetical protein
MARARTAEWTRSDWSRPINHAEIVVLWSPRFRASSADAPRFLSKIFRS